MQIGDIVCSRCGRDVGGIFIILDTEEEYLYLADGKSRRVEKPKRKKSKHVEFRAVGDGPLFVRLRQGDALTNRQVRQILTPFTLTDSPEQTDIDQATITLTGRDTSGKG